MTSFEEEAPVAEEVGGLVDEIELLVDVEQGFVEVFAENQTLDSLGKLRHLRQLEEKLLGLVERR